MKTLFLLLGMIAGTVCIAQNPKDSAVANPNYDKALAEKLGADDYGMKGYFLVILKTGKNNHSR